MSQNIAKSNVRYFIHEFEGKINGNIGRSGVLRYYNRYVDVLCQVRGYLTVTCHFLTKDFKLRSAVLSTNTLQDETNHKADNIGATLKTILEHWKIWKKVSAIVTDNEASMLKTVEIWKRGIILALHIL
ncbi:hypothetical protein ACLKA6_016351 [Drosophila palustris]